MLKSMFLSGVRPFYAPDDDRRAAAAAEREKIKVENIKAAAKVEEKEVEEKEEEIDDKGKSEEVSDEGKDDTEESEEEVEDKEEVKEATAEDLKKEVESLKKEVNRLQRRQGKTVAERDQIRKDLKAAKATLETKLAEGEVALTEEEVERRAEAKAEAKVTEREYQKTVQTLVKAAIKIDPKFEAKAQEMAQDVAPIPGFMIGALEDLDNGGAVLAHFVNNPDVYEEIFDLPPAKMVTRLAKLSTKIEEEGKAKPKKISKVPAPIEGIRGSEKSPTQLPTNPTKNMDEFIAMRNKQVAERRKAKFG